MWKVNILQHVRMLLIFLPPAPSLPSNPPDPEIHPQTEEYWGHVNPIGPRACYDEGKRVAETICYSYEKQVCKCIVW